MNDDFFVEDLAKALEKKEKKKVNSGRKGKHGERELCKLLIARFNDSFFRVVGSGNRWAQVELTEHAKSVLTGDVVCPPRFRFAIECKYGYDEVDVFGAMEKGNKQLDAFLEQASAAAGAQGKHPMLCWKKPHMPWVSFVPMESLPIGWLSKYPYVITYRNWAGVALSSLLKEEDSYFFLPS